MTSLLMYYLYDYLKGSHVPANVIEWTPETMRHRIYIFKVFKRYYHVKYLKENVNETFKCEKFIVGLLLWISLQIYKNVRKLYKDV